MAYYAGISQQPQLQSSPEIQGISISPPTPAPPFELTDQQGSPYGDKQLANHWSLLMLDPSEKQKPSPALIQLLQIHNRMANHPELQQSIHYLYLPRHQTATLDDSLSQIDINIHGLQGEPAKIDETFDHFGISLENTEQTLYLIDPQKHLRALFTQAEDAATIAEDLTKLITSTQ
jgi:cytochrome oxidase Cu insertion factor (SCO1/SenC/PrrC family)